MSVYFAQVGPYIKIGYSANPERRVRNLFKSATRYGAPEGTPLDPHSRRLIRTIDGTWDTEQLIHRALSDFRIRLEWYVDEPEVREFIATAETADHYEPLTRPAGPVRGLTCETDGMTPDELAHYRHVLNTLFAKTSLART